jgi:hypothetical protein
MGGSDMMRSQHSPARIIPQVGKITEDHGKTSGNKQRAVFHKHETRSNLTNNSCHVRPQTGLRSGDSGSLSGCADVLAGESAADDIDRFPPSLAVECSHVVPDWESVKASVSLSSE